MNLTGRHIYFLGIAGIGVSALAQVALARGARVSGADPNAIPEANPAVARLAADGATLYREHHVDNLAADVELVVASAAVPEDNPELWLARQRGLRVVSRAEFLGKLMAAHQGPKIAVAGTHGKTTTTAMIGLMLQHAGLDPTVFVGGEVAQLGGNVRVGGESGPFVAEACEAYDSFLSLRPDIAVITNIEADHLDHYGTYANVLNSFVRFANNVPEQSGRFVVCCDDAGVQDIMPQLEARSTIIGYQVEGDSLGCAAASTALNLKFSADRTTFCWRSDGENISMTLAVPGLHNVYNALAAATVGRLLGLSWQQIEAGLAAFHGATRRQEILGELGSGSMSILVMDDYAHHPTEIRATLSALRNAYPERRLTVVFQPHLYSRTRDFLTQFAEALALADTALVTDIYAAREEPIQGVSAKAICDFIAERYPKVHAVYIPAKRDIPSVLSNMARTGELVVFMGAGDIRDAGERYVQQLQQQKEAR